MDVFEVFEDYRLRYTRAVGAMPMRRPWIQEERDEIIKVLCESLGLKPQWIPEVNFSTVRETAGPGYHIEHLKAETWEHVHAAANLYLPENDSGPLPLILLACGHGAGGKLHAGYQRMAQVLASAGIAVLMPDNIGQGEREFMGHADCVKPFTCGISLQGLIVMETMGWVNCISDDKRFDPARLGIMGNSGGGKLAMLAGALCPALAAVVSSGYPSSFNFMAAKEKKHCHCNILPGLVGQIEMWQVLGCIAPRLLFIFQGENDQLFPVDLFHSTARQVSWVYHEKGVPNFRAETMPGAHSWDEDRIRIASEYWRDVFGLAADIPGAVPEALLSPDDINMVPRPGDAITVDELAEYLTGKTAPDNLLLRDVFVSPYDSDDLPRVTERADTRQILAQFEAFLIKGK